MFYFLTEKATRNRHYIERKIKRVFDFVLCVNCWSLKKENKLKHKLIARSSKILPDFAFEQSASKVDVVQPKYACLT